MLCLRIANVRIFRRFRGKADMMRSTTFKSFPLERSSHLTEFVPKVALT